MWSEQALPTDNSFRSIFKAKLLHLKVPTSVESIYFYPNHSYDWARIERDILYLTHPARFTVPSDYQWYDMSLQPDRLVPVQNTDPILYRYYSCLENMTSDAYFTPLSSSVCTPEKWKKPMLLTVIILLICIILIALIGKSFSTHIAQFVFITTMYVLLFFFVYKSQQNHILP